MKTIMCDSCGKVLEKSDGRWTHNDGRIICQECMNIPLDLLRDIHKMISDFDEESDETILKQED